MGLPWRRARRGSAKVILLLLQLSDLPIFLSDLELHVRISLVRPTQDLTTQRSRSGISTDALLAISMNRYPTLCADSSRPQALVVANVEVGVA
jgi:hypothetical protein